MTASLGKGKKVSDTGLALNEPLAWKVGSERGIEPRWRPFRPRLSTPSNTGLSRSEAETAEGNPCASCSRAFSPVRHYRPFWTVTPWRGNGLMAIRRINPRLIPLGRRIDVVSHLLACPREAPISVETAAGAGTHKKSGGSRRNHRHGVMSRRPRFAVSVSKAFLNET